MPRCRSGGAGFSLQRASARSGRAEALRRLKPAPQRAARKLSAVSLEHSAFGSARRACACVRGQPVPAKSDCGMKIVACCGENKTTVIQRAARKLSAVSFQHSAFGSARRACACVRGQPVPAKSDCGMKIVACCGENKTTVIQRAARKLSAVSFQHSAFGSAGRACACVRGQPVPAKSDGGMKIVACCGENKTTVIQCATRRLSAVSFHHSAFESAPSDDVLGQPIHAKSDCGMTSSRRAKNMKDRITTFDAHFQKAVGVLTEFGTAFLVFYKWR